MNPTSDGTRLPERSNLAKHFALRDGVVFLNHGSFGARSHDVMRAQNEWRARIEAQPVQFQVRDLERELDRARTVLAARIRADAADLAFVANATTGVNAVLRSLEFAPGDELLTTDHAYNACANALRETAARAGARVVVASIPFPIGSPDTVIARVLSCVTSRTRLALLDHVTSPTALVLPIETLVHELHERGVEVLVDGAHAVGMVPVDLDEIGAEYYTGNLHKWMCAPMGAAFLHVRRDRQASVRPLVVSHGANSTRTDRSRFLLEFDWTGTADPTPALCYPACEDFFEAHVPGGLDGAMQHNHALALRARDILVRALDVPAPAPDSMLGSMAAVPLPEGDGSTPSSPLYSDPLQDQLRELGIEVPIVPFPGPPRRLVRVSAQVYNSAAEYDYLAHALRGLLGR